MLRLGFGGPLLQHRRQRSRDVGHATHEEMLWTALPVVATEQDASGTALANLTFVPAIPLDNKGSCHYNCDDPIVTVMAIAPSISRCMDNSPADRAAASHARPSPNAYASAVGRQPQSNTPTRKLRATPTDSLHWSHHEPKQRRGVHHRRSHSGSWIGSSSPPLSSQRLPTGSEFLASLSVEERALFEADPQVQQSMLQYYSELRKKDPNKPLQDTNNSLGAFTPEPAAEHSNSIMDRIGMELHDLSTTSSRSRNLTPTRRGHPPPLTSKSPLSDHMVEDKNFMDRVGIEVPNPSTMGQRRRCRTPTPRRHSPVSHASNGKVVGTRTEDQAGHESTAKINKKGPLCTFRFRSPHCGGSPHRTGTSPNRVTGNVTPSNRCESQDQPWLAIDLDSRLQKALLDWYCQRQEYHKKYQSSIDSRHSGGMEELKQLFSDLGIELNRHQTETVASEICRHQDLSPLKRDSDMALNGDDCDEDDVNSGTGSSVFTSKVNRNDLKDSQTASVSQEQAYSWAIMDAAETDLLADSFENHQNPEAICAAPEEMATEGIAWIEDEIAIDMNNHGHERPEIQITRAGQLGESWEQAQTDNLTVDSSPPFRFSKRDYLDDSDFEALLRTLESTGA